MSEKVSFEIDKEVVERPTHQVESEIRQTVKIDHVDTTPVDSESKRGRVIKIDLIKKLTKADKVLVENDKIDRDRVDSTTTPKRVRGKVDMSWLRILSSSQSILEQGRVM